MARRAEGLGAARVKGLAILNVVDAMKAARPDAADLVDDNLRPYVEGRILVSSWYPEEAHLRLMRVLADWMQRPGKDVWVYLGRKNAEIDLGGVYSAMVLRGNPSATLHRFPKLWGLYRDTGTPRIVDTARGEARVDLVDYPFVGPEISGLVAGFLGEMVRRGGAEYVEVTALETPHDPQPRDGAPSVLRWRAVWTEP